MNHSDFRVGETFYCGGKHWRCTDIGSRTIVAICLEPQDVVLIDTGEVPRVAHRIVSDDPSWLNGPPFAVAELVFDEVDLDVGSPTPEKSKKLK